MPTPRRRLFEFPWRSSNQIARDVDAELAFHLESRVAELIATGLTRERAEAQAREEFGDVEFTRKYCRAVDAGTERSLRFRDRWSAWMDDVRYAVRTLRRSPAFALVSLLTLTLAIGANTAIFTVTRAVLLRPLPYGNPGALTLLFENWPGHPIPASHTPLSPPDFADIRSQQHSFSSVSAATPGGATWRPVNGDPVVLNTLRVTADMFTTLQVPALLGHTFAAGDDAEGAAPKVVLSYALWQRDFGGDPAAVGRTLMLDGQSTELIGVMPKGFTFWGTEDAWTPLDLSGDLRNAAVTRKQHWLHVVARLKPGVVASAADAELLSISHRLAVDFPAADSGRASFSLPLHPFMTRDLRPALLLLMAGAGLVLLIACANLANVTLSRTTSRRRELAVRAALGAGRGRIMRQLLIESTLIAVVGGALGVALASVATRVLLALNPEALPSIFVVGVDARVLCFSLVMSIGTGLLFGLIPARDASRADLNGSLRDGGRGTAGGRAGTRARRALVVVQVGLAVVLLVGAGLLIRSFREIISTPLGFATDQVMTAQVNASGTRYDSATAVNQFYDAVLDKLAHSPGVIAVGAASQAPQQGRVNTSLRIEGQPADETRLPDLGYIGVRGDYFKVLHIPLLAGRLYLPTDDASQGKVAVINDVAARRFFPNGDAVGHRIRIGPRPDGPWMTIIGVVGDIRDEQAETASEPTLFANHIQEAWESSLTLLVRTSGDPATATPLIRRAVSAADPTVAVRDIKPLDEVVGSRLAARRFALALITAFSGIALLLAAVGIYGVLSYSVTSRTREFGVRLAIGATRQSVLGLVVRQGLGWSMLGLMAGIAVAAGVTRLMAGMLYGVTPLDPLTFVAVSGGLVLVVIAACLVPALRATRVDPLESMRAE